jgi:serine/threonine protein kinase
VSSTNPATSQHVADYEIVRSLGRGANGVFHLARPPSRLGRGDDLVALKVLDGRHDPTRFRRVTEELRLFAAIPSPYLVELIDAGNEDGTLWYTMEYLPGGSLAEPQVPLDRAARLRAVAHVAHGAHALHEAGLAHRDLKPANVLLHDGGAKVADLELARFLQPGMTVTANAPVGDLEFTDPVLLKGDRASRATDIWSLGMILHHVFASRSAYPDLDPAAGVLGAVRRLLAAPPDIDPGLEPVVAEVVRLCLAPDPDERPATAAALAARIEAL